MSETEEPPAKLAKTDNEEATPVSEETETSNLTDCSGMPETDPEAPDMPEGDIPSTMQEPLDEPVQEAHDAPVVQESLDMPTMQESLDLPAMQESLDMPAMQDSLELSEAVSMESAEMVEERLQDSLESQDPAESQEGHEEWLSEDVLTDEDFNPAVESAPDSQSSQPGNQLATDSETNTPETKSEQGNTDPATIASEAKVPEQNIEDALNSLEGGTEREDEMPDLDAFLIKKTEVKAEVTKPKAEAAEQQKDDGNDTDDLLRMLGEDNSKAKKLTKTVKDVRSNAGEVASSDEDDFVFEGGSAKKLKLAKTVKMPSKAETEDMNEHTDQSSDEADTMKKIFSSKSKGSTKQDRSRSQHKTLAKNIVNVVERPRKDRVTTSTPLKTGRMRSLLRAAPLAPAPPAAPAPPTQLKREPHHQTYSRKEPQATEQTTMRATSILKSLKEPKVETIEETNQEEFLEEDFDMPEEGFDSEFEDEGGRGRREAAPSDPPSHSEDGSLYDELPSSESEDADDWFQLDIRAEKAGDYLPLLGPKAKLLLLEEKRRVTSRLANLKQSLSALIDSGKKQAEQVRTATMALAELDDMLKAS